MRPSAKSEILVDLAKTKSMTGPAPRRSTRLKSADSDEYDLLDLSTVLPSKAKKRKADAMLHSQDSRPTKAKPHLRFNEKRSNNVLQGPNNELEAANPSSESSQFASTGRELEITRLKEKLAKVERERKSTIELKRRRLITSRKNLAPYSKIATAWQT